MSPSSHTLLQDLICAATHSQAAYGHAMQAGLFDSITSYVYLQTIQVQFHICYC